MRSPQGTVTELVRQIAAGSVSPVEIVDDALDRVAAADPVLHAFCTPTPEPARRRARDVERAVRAGTAGPLAGVPYAVKDLICTKGIRTTSGSAAYADFVPDTDDVAVERLDTAGAINLGKTNASEFGFSASGHNVLFPATRNPWDPTRTPGGSSAGSAVAVAAGMVPFALGSDGGGSIRIPAALTGLVGFKPSMGRVPVYPGCRDHRYPGVSGWESIEHIGPIARTVADVALIMNTLAGPDPRDRHTIPGGDVDWANTTDETDLRGIRIGYTADFGYLPVDPQVRAATDRAADRFARELGATVEHFVPGWPDPAPHFTALIMADTDLVGLRRMVRDIGDRMSPHLVQILETPWTAEDLTQALMMRKAVVNHMIEVMRRFDLILSPTTAVAAFDLDSVGPTEIDGRTVSPTTWQGFTPIANLTGQPAISVPSGTTEAGLPVGIQLIGGHLADGTVLRAAAAYERAARADGGWPDLAPASAAEHLGHRPATRISSALDNKEIR
ncbi:amidase [Nocardia aurantia]|uniref:amidase n=1 Tax=Nocardia aurantia TaxID=2585199 RepID=A0A7K0E456_9NOCA|nr:amidase [Nocardia aurantia]MQY31954.1 Acylamidase [Nocardia aurantia]